MQSIDLILRIVNQLVVLVYELSHGSRRILQVVLWLARLLLIAESGQELAACDFVHSLQRGFHDLADELLPLRLTLLVLQLDELLALVPLNDKLKLLRFDEAILAEG